MPSMGPAPDPAFCSPAPSVRADGMQFTQRDARALPASAPKAFAVERGGAEVKAAMLTPEHGSGSRRSSTRVGLQALPCSTQSLISW